MLISSLILILKLIFVKEAYASSIRTHLIATIFDEPSSMLTRIGTVGLQDNEIPTGTILDPSEVKGYIADLASTIFQEKLKVPYKFVIERSYGREVGKGIWNGLMGSLVNRSADLAIAQLLITRKRAEAVTFSYPFLSSGISLMMRKPPRMKPVWLPTLFD